MQLVDTLAACTVGTWRLRSDRGGGPWAGIPAAGRLARHAGGLGRDVPPAVGARAAAPGGVRAAERRPRLAACHHRQSGAPGGAAWRTVIDPPPPPRPPRVLRTRTDTAG